MRTDTSVDDLTEAREKLVEYFGGAYREEIHEAAPAIVELAQAMREHVCADIVPHDMMLVLAARMHLCKFDPVARDHLLVHAIQRAEKTERENKMLLETIAELRAELTSTAAENEMLHKRVLRLAEQVN